MKQQKPVDDIAAVEEALVIRPEPEHYLLRLYVTGTTPRSARATQNVRTICEEKLPGRYDLEVVDVYQRPQLAGRNQVVVISCTCQKAAIARPKADWRPVG